MSNQQVIQFFNIIKQKLLPDKSTIVVEILNKNVNGQIEKIAKAFQSLDNDIEIALQYAGANYVDYLTKGKFELPHLQDHVKEGTDTNTSIGNYFSTMLDQSMNWKDAEKLCSQWGGHFALKGIMSVDDAKRAVDIGCTGIMVSNHGGRQLDGSRAPFDQLAEIVNAVGDKIDVVMDSGIQRGSHVLKALSLGAKAVGGGRFYLYALAAAGQPGVERALDLMRIEIERDMRLMGVKSTTELSPKNLRFR